MLTWILWEHSHVLECIKCNRAALACIIQLLCTLNALAWTKCTRTVCYQHTRFITNLPRHVRVWAFNYKLTVPLDLNLMLVSIYSQVLPLFHWAVSPCSRVRAACSRVRATCSHAWFYLQFKLTLTCNYSHASGIMQSVDTPKQDYMLLCIILLTI